MLLAPASSILNANLEHSDVLNQQKSFDFVGGSVFQNDISSW